MFCVYVWMCVWVYAFIEELYITNVSWCLSLYIYIHCVLYTYFHNPIRSKWLFFFLRIYMLLSFAFLVIICSETIFNAALWGYWISNELNQYIELYTVYKNDRCTFVHIYIYENIGMVEAIQSTPFGLINSKFESKP